MPIQRRSDPSRYPSTRRQGFIDPRAYDNPPCGAGHPITWEVYGKYRVWHELDCRYCRNTELSQAVTTPHHARLQFTWKHSLASLDSAHDLGYHENIYHPVKSLPRQLKHKPRPKISWPFLREVHLADKLSIEVARDEDDGIDISAEAVCSGTALGPLGAIIAELRNRPSPRDLPRIRSPLLSLGTLGREGENVATPFTRRDMRAIWAHWVGIMAREDGCRGGRIGRERRIVVMSEMDHER